MNTATQPQTLMQAREIANLTQEDLAKLLGMTRTSISHWEQGRTVPSGSARLLLASIFGVPVEVIDGWFSANQEPEKQEHGGDDPLLNREPVAHGDL